LCESLKLQVLLLISNEGKNILTPYSGYTFLTEGFYSKCYLWKDASSLTVLCMLSGLLS